jgi:hypothetical protein
MHSQPPAAGPPLICFAGLTIIPLRDRKATRRSIPIRRWAVYLNMGARRDAALQKPTKTRCHALQIFAQIFELGHVTANQLLEVVVIHELLLGIDFGV